MNLEELILNYRVELYVVGEKTKRHIKIVAVPEDNPKAPCLVGRGKTLQQAVDNVTRNL